MSENDREIPPTAFIGCDYEEFRPSSYKGVTCKIESHDDSWGENHIFYSVSPLRDKNNAISLAKEKGAKIFVSSSWDNFVTDALREIVRLAKTPIEHDVGSPPLTSKDN